MKKTITFFFLGIFSFGAHAQIGQRPHEKFSTETGNQAPIYELTPKSGGDIVWQNNFNTPSQWVINNSGQTGPTYGWSIGPTENSWWAVNVINSTSGGNFAQVNNGNPTLNPGTQALGVTYTLTTASPVIIPHSYLELSFEQYGARYNDVQEVYISIDNVNWVKVGDNSDMPVYTSVNGAPYVNSTLKTLNLSNFIPVGNTQIWVRFSWTTAYPAEASNPNAWVTYGWFIDDVMLTELYQNDLKLDKALWGTANLNTLNGTSDNQIIPYYQIPKVQVSPIAFGGVVSNQGVLDKTDAVFKASIASAGYTGQSAPSSILAGGTETLLITAGFTPIGSTATYLINGFTVETATDEVLSNNSLATTYGFEVTNSVYAKDNGILSGRYQADDDGILCNQFDIYSNQNMVSIAVYIDSLTAVGSQFEVQIYDEFFTLIAVSNVHTFTSAEVNSFVTVDLMSPLMLNQGVTYLACVKAVNTLGLNGLVIGTANPAPKITSFEYLSSASTWYYTNNTPMIRIKMECLAVFANNPQTICEGGSYSIGANTYTVAGTYLDLLQSVNGCDSTVTTFLTVNPSFSVNNPQTVCAGESYIVGTNTYTVSGTYTDVLQTALGCDSTVTTVLTVRPELMSNNHQTVCVGGSYSINGNTYLTSGTYTDVFQAVNGCDSTVTTFLNVLSALVSNNPQTICSGDSYAIGTNTYTVTGTYIDVLQSVNGCDSTVTTVLTVTNPSLNTAVSISGITLTASETNASYQWVDCDNSNSPISGATSQSYTATSNGSYAVILTSNSCSEVETSSCFNISQVGVDKLDKGAKFVIFPNPAQDFVRISVSEGQIEGIQIFDVNGKLLAEPIVTGTEVEVNTSRLSGGVYLLKIQTEKGISINRFTIQ